MRRPTPLPPPGGAARSDDRLRPREEAPAPASVDTAQDQQETAPIAPLFLRADAPVESVDAVAPAESQAPDVDADTTTGPVSWRDVWRAARARRRALRAEVRRFTVRQRRRRMMWIGVAASLVVMTGATIGAAYSPLFAVENIQVVGTSGLDAATVAASLDAQRGTPLAAIDESAVKAALVAFPLVESYTLEARPPHDLVVRIVERTPIGVVSSEAGYTLVDAAGVALATTPDPPAGYPIVDATGGVGGDAFTAIGLTMRALPTELRGQVTSVSASTANDVTLTLGGTGTQVVWGSADESALKARVLQLAMNNRPPDGVAVYDVSSAKIAVVR